MLHYTTVLRCDVLLGAETNFQKMANYSMQRLTFDSEVQSPTEVSNSAPDHIE